MQETPPDSSVNVEQARNDFEDLDRQLSRISNSQLSTPRNERDVEKGEAGDEPFDLLEYMRTTSAEQDAAGFKRKHVGVVWRDLTVVGSGGNKSYIRIFPEELLHQVLAPVRLLLSQVGLTRREPKLKTILHQFNGVLKPGEMCLVLGRPDSGCSTFLKVIANQRSTFIGVDGEITYAGVRATEMAKRFKGETVYNQEADLHYSTLTVKQTLTTALDLKSPGKRLPGSTRQEMNETILATLLKMLGISHTKNTLVGDENVRGISGGERKRISIAEMMATRACVASWDNSTRGLDASSALDYAKSLRILTDIRKDTTFVTLYQAGERIYEQFDKVLVIDEGRQVYFGPASDARAYFVSLGFRDLPRQTTADFLSGCTDPNERRPAEGRDPSTVPNTPEQLEAAFRASKHFANMQRDQVEYENYIASNDQVQKEFREAVLEDKRKGVPHRSPYTVSFLAQVQVLTKRQLQLKFQDWFSVVTGFITSLSLGLIIGSLFYNLPPTASGAFTRGGAIFVSLLFNALTAFNELNPQMQGRPILFRQSHGYKFYRPAAFGLAQMLAEVPTSFIQTLLFTIPVYFMAHFAREAGAYFIFLLFVYFIYLIATCFFRCIGTYFSGFDTAIRMAAVLFITMVVYSGYLLPVFAMKRWLFWIYHVNPFRYAFEAIVANELSRLNLTCDQAYIVPRNFPGLDLYPNTVGPYQTCALIGGSPGVPEVSGSKYIQAALEFDPANIWRNFGICIAFYVVLQFTQMLLMEKFLHLPSGAEQIQYVRETQDTKQRNMALQARKHSDKPDQEKQSLSGIRPHKKPLTWENLTYRVPDATEKGPKVILNSIFGYATPGTLTALMGASGAGKTTLLDVLAGRKNVGVITGDILLNGRPLGIDFARGTAYCEQLDVHEPTATVREAFRFSAYLRQDANVSKESKDEYCEEIIRLLELEEYADAIIGGPGNGLSVEARKRVTIGVELAAKPQVMLVLDEPTSGLDGQSAFNVVRLLKKLAAAGQTIICTIHQPNALLFETFDRLLLLQRCGAENVLSTVYFGPIGPDSRDLLAYFAKNGAHCPPTVNPAEWMLDAIGAGSQKRIGSRDWADVWATSPELAQIKRDIQNLKAEAISHEEDPVIGGQYATSFLTQLRVVCKRATVSFWRMPDYGLTRLFLHTVIPIITSLTFLQLGNSAADIQSRVFVAFVTNVLPALVIVQIEPQFIAARQVFVREASSRIYSTFAFAASQLVAEAPYSFICAVTYFLLIYWPSGFQPQADRSGYTFLLVVITGQFATSLAQMVAALSPSVVTAALLNPFLILIFALFCGIVIPKPLLPEFWRSWLYELNPFTRLVSGLVTTELHGLTVRCNPGEVARFFHPPNTTCEEWAGPFMQGWGGYLVDAGVPDMCGWCPYENGDRYLAGLDISFNNRWRDLGIFASFLVSNAIIVLVASRFLRYAKR